MCFVSWPDEALGHEEDVLAGVLVRQVGMLLAQVRERDVDDVVLGVARQGRAARALQHVVEAELARASAGGAHDENLTGSAPRPCRNGFAHRTGGPAGSQSGNRARSRSKMIAESVRASRAP